MLKIGLTGGIGSGKTTVSDRFKNIGIPVIDTDVIAHELVNQNTAVLDEIAETFGNSIVDNGLLNRQQLANIVFNDSNKKQQLENILHPKIREQVKQQLKTLEENHQRSPDSVQYCIIVIPLLFETGHYANSFHGLIDRVLLVMADEDCRIERITQRDNRNLDEISAIIKTQLDDETKMANADDVLNNNSDIKTLESEVELLHIKYCGLAKSSL